MAYSPSKKVGGTNREKGIYTQEKRAIKGVNQVASIVALLIVIAIIAVVWISMNNQSNQEAMRGATAQRITPQFYQATLAPNDHLLVDVRSAEEFRTGHIPGAINIALPDLPQQMDTLSKEQPIVLYCRSGARSNAAAQMLSKAGFNHVHDLGGIITWQAQGLPVQ
jgi:rhodanese-related sulfurtransferase